MKYSYSKNSLQLLQSWQQQLLIGKANKSVIHFDPVRMPGQVSVSKSKHSNFAFDETPSEEKASQL